MSFNDLARKRYSCRKLAAKPVEQEKLDAIIEAGILAPTAVNKQPFRIWVAKSPEAVKAIHDVTPFTALRTRRTSRMSMRQSLRRT